MGVAGIHAQGGNSMLSTLAQIVRRYPLTTFVVLSYLFSWWPWALQLPMGVIIGFGPFFAALVVLGLTEGWSGVKRLFGEMVRWRVGLPIVLATAAAYLTVLSGAPAPTAEQLSRWTELPVLLVLFLLVPGISGAWEEPGWRGYAVNHLERRLSRLRALLPLWAMITVWHVPLFLTGGIEWADVVSMAASVVIYNWLYHGSGKSVLLVMVIHAMNNTVSGEFFSPMFTGDYSPLNGLWRAVVWVVVGLVVLVANWKWWTGRARVDVPAEGVPHPA
jgi:hypothetical protein